MTSVFKDFDQAPALEAAKRAGFHDAHAIANLGFVLFVMNVELLYLLDDFAKKRVRNTSDRLDHDGLVHLVGDHFPDTGFAK